MKDTAAIIVAGGKGLRYGGCVRKQYLLLKGKPIVWWSLRAFEKSPSVGTVILVAPQGDVPRLGKQIKRWKFKKCLRVEAGGITRADSVRQGLKAVPKHFHHVAVHDAVRPLVTPALIEKVIAVARRSRAALAACPSKDTVKLVKANGYVHATPPRETVWLAQTPQIFERKLLERAHAQGSKKNVTDDSQLVEHLGVRVRLVEAPPENLKITQPMDLMLAKAILES
jgi:2-C-methyl-D-erythritol 4-phosphate cytidylyltransferase